MWTIFLNKKFLKKSWLSSISLIRMVNTKIDLLSNKPENQPIDALGLGLR